MYKIIIWFFENWLNKAKVQEYIISRAINLPLEGEVKTFVNKQYKRIVEKKLPLKTEMVKVKKGKKKYTLAFFETQQGELKVNINRHEYAL